MAVVITGAAEEAVQVVEVARVNQAILVAQVEVERLEKDILVRLVLLTADREEFRILVAEAVELVPVLATRTVELDLPGTEHTTVAVVAAV